MRKPLVLLVLLALCSCDKPAPSKGPEAGAPATSPPGPAAVIAPEHPAPAPAGHEGIHGVVIPDPTRTRTVSLRHAGIITSLPHAPGEKVHAGDVLAEVDSPEVARTVFELRRLEADYQAARGAQANAEARVEIQKSLSEAKSAQADIAEEQMIALRMANEPDTSRNLTDIRLAAIALRAEASQLEQSVEAARREISQARDRAETLLRSAAALRAFIGPQVEPPGSQGRWAADLERPNILRLDSPIEGQIVSVPARFGDGLAAGAPVVRVSDLSWVAIQPTAEDEPALLELAGRTVKIRDEGGKDLGEGTVSVEWTGDEGGRRAWVSVANGAGALRLGGRVVIEPGETPHPG